MGALISRWRTKPSTIEVLEKIEKEIEAIETLRRTNLQQQKKLIGSLILYSVLLYIVSAILFYFYYLPDQWTDKFLYSTPLLVFPVLVWGLKRFLHWYFVKRIARNECALEELRERKKTILEEVMEKETYKKAKEILDKFDPEKTKNIQAASATPAPAQAPEGQELRQRTGAQVGVTSPAPTPQPKAGHLLSPTTLPPQVGSPGPSRPMPSPGSAFIQRNGQQRLRGGPMPAQMTLPPGPPMARPVLPRERGTVDKLVEFLVGDGPQNRYALICSECHSHNGMALREEFEYLSFRCCYCYSLNPARKQRPRAPGLQSTPLRSRKVLETRNKDREERRSSQEEGAAAGEQRTSQEEEDMDSADTESTGSDNDLPATNTSLATEVMTGQGHQTGPGQVKGSKS